MGILYNKERIMDTIITLEGRRQMVGGKFKIEFASFSDRGTFYQADEISGSSDASDRIFFEAVSLENDQITFESDDSGRLIDYKGQSGIEIKNGKIVTSGSFLTDPGQFSSTANTFLNNVFDNYCNLQSIGTNDFFRDDKDFQVSSNNVEFTITEDFPLKRNDVRNITLEKADSFFEDKRLSHIKNFKYLPPLNLSPLEQQKGNNSSTVNTLKADALSTPLGIYNKLSSAEIYRFANLINELQTRERKEINFTETSRHNNIFCQFFEINSGEVIKLDVIDFGLFNKSASDSVRIFFVGKIYVDSLNRSTFIHLFTLLFE